MRTVQIVVEQGLDEKGQPEEFTWDLYPLVDNAETQHLTDDGLPKKGTFIKQGMAVVGKRGRGAAFNPNKLPTSLEMYAWDRRQIAAMYPDYWVDTSCYASQDMGRVTGARFETRGGKLCAVVDLCTGDEPGFS
jgi:hypothetical protein